MTWLSYALTSAVFASITAILAKVGIKGVDSNLATAIRTIVILIFSWGIVASQGTYRQLHELSPKTITFLILSGIATGLSWLAYFKALQMGNASQVAPIDKLSVALTVILAVIFFKEKLTLHIIVGTLLIVSGVILVSLSK